MLYGPHGRAQRKCPRCRWIVEDEGKREGTVVKLRTSTTLCITSGGGLLRPIEAMAIFGYVLFRVIVFIGK